jgi:hypothetical protein
MLITYAHHRGWRGGKLVTLCKQLNTITLGAVVRM